MRLDDELTRPVRGSFGVAAARRRSGRARRRDEPAPPADAAQPRTRRLDLHVELRRRTRRRRSDRARHRRRRRRGGLRLDAGVDQGLPIPRGYERGPARARRRSRAARRRARSGRVLSPARGIVSRSTSISRTARAWSWSTGSRPDGAPRGSGGRSTSTTARLSARIDGTLVVHDALALRGDDGDLAARLGRFDVLASVLVLGTALGSYAAALVSRVAQRSLERRSDRLVTAAALPRAALATLDASFGWRGVRWSTSDVRFEYLGFVPELLGDDPWVRKW